MIVDLHVDLARVDGGGEVVGDDVWGGGCLAEENHGLHCVHGYGMVRSDKQIGLADFGAKWLCCLIGHIWSEYAPLTPDVPNLSVPIESHQDGPGRPQNRQPRG